MTLGERIYRFRTAKNLSQGDLAEVLDVSRQSVSKWETGASVPELDKLVKMSDLFGVSLDELVRGMGTVPAGAAAPQSKSLAPIGIVGICLMGFGALALLVFLAVDRPALAAFLSLPVLVCGLICLLVKWHPLLLCLWVVWGVWAFCFERMVYFWQAELMVVFVLFFVGLVVATVFGISGGKDKKEGAG